MRLEAELASFRREDFKITIDKILNSLTTKTIRAAILDVVSKQEFPKNYGRILWKIRREKLKKSKKWWR
jgi:hypothetical protein